MNTYLITITYADKIKWFKDFIIQAETKELAERLVTNSEGEFFNTLQINIETKCIDIVHKPYQILYLE